MSPNPSNVIAVVVTYRRPTLLKRCLIAIEKQTLRPDAIIVVDNCSGDSTPEIVQETTPNATFVQLAQNTGGAGGFNHGIEAALKTGAEWIWLMDDDGTPDEDCLEQLRKAVATDPTADLLGPLVCAEGNPERLAFNLKTKSKATIRTTADAISHARGNVIDGDCNPFNGILIHRRVPEAVGLPIKEMFIWGDEVEYLHRITSAGFRVITCINARMLHPRKPLSKPIRLLGIQANVTVTTDRARHLIRLRNHAYIARRYHGIIGIAKYTTKYTLFALSTDGLDSALETLRYCIHGAMGKWTTQGKPQGR